eukprot:scaffold25470_cov63-Phaeocystis_antarctica.AAC.1
MGGGCSGCRGGDRVAALLRMKRMFSFFLFACRPRCLTLQHRCGRVQAEFTSTRRWALALRPEHHPGSDQSGHAEQPAAVTASAVGGSATRSVVAESLNRRRAVPPRRAIARAPRRACVPASGRESARRRELRPHGLQSTKQASAELY